MTKEKTTTAERNKIRNAFPKSLAQDVNSLLDKLQLNTKYGSTECFQINYDREVLIIPYRIYYDDPIQNNFTDDEKFLLDCLFTRHHDGHVREKHLKGILTLDSYLTTPFIA